MSLTDEQLANLTDQEQVELITDTVNDLAPEDVDLPQPPQDPGYPIQLHRLGRRQGYDSGESIKEAEARAKRRASLPIEEEWPT